MFKTIEPILWEFRSCFSRKAAFSWFLIIIVGLLVRFDHFGISSFIRWLFLNPEYYDPMLRFFRATSWNLEVVLARWTTIAITQYPTIELNGRKVLIGDGIKVEAVEELESLASQGFIDSVVEGSSRIPGISRKPDRSKRFVILGFLKSEFFNCLR